MASSLQFPFLLLFMLLYVILLPSTPVHCVIDNEEDLMLKGINSYRESLKLKSLQTNEKAMCLASRMAKQLDQSQTCNGTANTTIVSGMGSHPTLIGNYTTHLMKCRIDINTTRDGVMLPICSTKLIVTTLGCAVNCPHWEYSKYFRNPNYTAAGICTSNSWKVIVLSTNTTSGSFSRAADSDLSRFWTSGLSHCLLLVLGLLLFVLN